MESELLPTPRRSLDMKCSLMVCSQTLSAEDALPGAAGRSQSVCVCVCSPGVAGRGSRLRRGAREQTAQTIRRTPLRVTMFDNRL